VTVPGKWRTKIEAGTLRRWFAPDRAEWNEFCRCYARKLEKPPWALAPLIALAAKGKVPLLFAAKDAARTKAVALQA
jgi:uncharacterized protein YeaO (DUF488 family)